MSRERSMQRLNMLALAAFLLALGAFVYDTATPRPARIVAELTGPAAATSALGTSTAANPAS